ncbi:MAG: efflux RND transporter periplasmic adaptor subunit [Pirellula sp.]|nr:efflux RND transporter periplasmic adaptor subunit [Pirellula sp.]
MNTRMYTRSFLFALLAIPLAIPWARGHEGHQPLPSKGVQVNTETGQVTLSGQARDTLGVRSEEITAGEVSSTLQVYAETIAPWQSRALGSAQLPGRISKLLVRPGDFVQANQVVAELSSRELEIVKLEFQQAQREVALNRRLLEITKPTANSGAVPMQRLIDLENAFQQSLNRLEIARVRASTLGMDWTESTAVDDLEAVHQIRSPIDGQIVHSDLSEGKYVEAFEHLFEIVNSKTIWVRLQLLEKDVFQVAIGQSVKLKLLDSSLELDGRIESIDASMDPKSQVTWAWMTVSHSEVVPGMVGQATIRTSTRSDTLTVPQRAVFSDGLQSYVFVEEASTKASAEYRKRVVKLGKRRLNSNNAMHPHVEIVQGDIYPGDRVVVVGGHELSSLFFLGVLKLSESDRERLGIATIKVDSKAIARTVALPAVVSLPPESRNVISSQLDGTIRSHTLSPGRDVRSGELLLEIASPEFYQLQLDLLMATMESARLKSRAERLNEVKGDAVSMRVAIESLAQAEQWEIRSQSLQRQLETLGLSKREIESIAREAKILDYLPIRASIDGKIASSVSTLGETVIANQPLVEVQNVDAIWIEAFVPNTSSGAIKVANRGIATLLAQPEDQIPVIVTRTGPIIDETTRTQRVWLAPNARNSPMPLRAGMLLSVAMEVENGDAVLAVPNSALIRDGLHVFVFVQNDKGYIERRRVTTGRSDGSWSEIVSGISDGETVVSAGGRDLQTAYASLR